MIIYKNYFREYFNKNIITILIGFKLSDSLIDEKRKKETNNKICLSKEEYNLFRKQQIIWKFIKIVSIG